MYKSCPTNMVIFVFIVDTSASMNQRTSIGTTLLDVAKNAVETFTKVKYVLLSQWRLRTVPTLYD